VHGQCRTLVLTADAELLDDLLGVAAAVGVAVDVDVDPATCHPQWIAAPLVLVGSDLAPRLAPAGLPRRAGVLLVARGTLRQETWAAAAQAGADDMIGLPDGEPTLAGRLAEIAEPAGSTAVLAVVPGCGGAGGSVLAAALALSAAQLHGGSWLVDLDPLGGGIDVGLGAELDSGARWPDLPATGGRVSARALQAALVEVSGVRVLSCDPRSTEDPDPATVRAVLSAACRTGGTVVLDLPRHSTAAREQALTATDEVLVVVPGEVRAVLATRQLLRRLGPVPASVRGVVRTTRGGVPADEVARSLGVPLAGELEAETAVRSAMLAGRPADLVAGTSLGALCQRLLTAPAAAGRAA
jgi:secretion/DNA translocation related CpaE-like protein